jgi:hypothetical protein
LLEFADWQVIPHVEQPGSLGDSKNALELLEGVPDEVGKARLLLCSITAARLKSVARDPCGQSGCCQISPLLKEAYTAREDLRPEDIAV